MLCSNVIESPIYNGNLFLKAQVCAAHLHGDDV